MKAKFINSAKEYEKAILEIKILEQKIKQSKEEVDELNLETHEVKLTQITI